ncbi:Gti1/Pac2 family-domain-containing protein [Flammula alnicola]|nr:Gti1/Pac2 family-domain-containing protein [Flammula alnicola]
MTSNPDVPPFTGYVETTVNALRLIHAARQGVIPRITRRLNDSERRTMIKSGAVFVFSVEESGIKRWTDGLLWSPSRIVGNFLVYREINERTSSRGSHKKPYPSDDSPTRTLARKSSPDQISMGFKGHPADQGTFKAGGLIKKTITVTIEDSDLHLISYYTSDDIRSGKLKRPSTRSDIMGLYMPPHIFRLTNFRVPPKVEIGPDGKPRLVAVSSSEAEDVEPVDCKVEDHPYNIPASPTWSSQGSPTSPVENPFVGSSMYPLGERWPIQGESLIPPMNRQELGWGSTGSSMSSSHSMSRRREGSLLQSTSDAWPPIHSQSGRWQGTHDSPSSPLPSSGMYQDRTRVRASHQYDENQAMHRRDNEGMQQSYPVRYTPHPTGTREGALQRLHWPTRDTADNARDPRRGTPHSNSSFSSSPTLPFTAQGFHTTAPTYTSSWTSSDANLLTTPTLHSVSNQPAISYNGTYPSTSASISSPDEYPNVEEFRDS